MPTEPEKDLKDSVGTGESPKPKEEKVMTVTTAQWTALMQEIQNLKTGSKIEKPKRVTEHFATLRFCNDKPVIGFDSFQEVLEDGKRVAYVNLTLDGGEVVTVPYLEFLNEGNGEKVKIISQKASEHVKSYGQVRAINPDPKNVKTWDGGMIDLDVTSVTYQAEVEVTEGPHQGQKFSVPTTCLNA